MNRSLIPSTPLQPPKALEKFLSDPPLVGHERVEDFRQFFLAIAAAVRPVDTICWLLISDLAAIWWEIRRERLIKAEIIRQKQQEVVTPRYTRAHYERDLRQPSQSAFEDAPSQFRKKGSEPVEQKPEDPVSLLAKAYLNSGDQIEFCDRRIAALENRRIVFLNEVERRNQNLARRADVTASEVVDAEFTSAED